MSRLLILLLCMHILRDKSHICFYSHFVKLKAKSNVKMLIGDNNLSLAAPYFICLSIDYAVTINLFDLFPIT